MSYTPTVWVNDSEPAISAANLSHIETAIDELDARFGAGAAGVAREPFQSIHTVDAAAPGLVDKAGHLLATAFTGDYGASTGTNATFGWGLVVFSTTGTAAGDGTGGDFSNLIEFDVRAPSGTIDTVKGLQAEASFFGASAGATVTRMTSMHVAAPIRKDGATAGTATNVYGLYVESVSTVATDADTAYAVYVAGNPAEGAAGASPCFFGGPTTINPGHEDDVPLTLKCAPAIEVNALTIVDVFDQVLARVDNLGFVASVSRIVAFEGQSPQVTLGDMGPSAQPGISFGEALDMALYRVAAGSFGWAAGSAPADAALANGHVSLWFDGTSGAAKLMIKAKDAGGTVRTGQVALS